MADATLLKKPPHSLPRNSSTMPTRVASLAAARSIQLVLMDVDGVMTDGSIYFVDGKSEGRVFDAKDGVGIWLLRRAGLATGVISGRSSAAVRRRVKELAMEEVHLKVRNKQDAYQDILDRRKLSHKSVCFIGDDVVDLEVLALVGLAAAPSDAHPEVLKRIAFVTRAPGGRGAVREVADFILTAQGKMGGLLRALLGEDH
jgi:3-deoxy-D-manno-octulosonate 8-phosphate phosphatase (KDO 8-P phosphatase)